MLSFYSHFYFIYLTAKLISAKATTKKIKGFKNFILIFCGLVLKIVDFYGYKSNQFY